MSFSWQDFVEFLPILLAGAWMTVKLSVVSMTLALSLGVVMALARGSSNRLIRWPAAFYIDFLRGTPLLLQIFYVYYALPLAGIRFDSFTAGVLSLGINYSAYLAEVFRSGIQAIPYGQREAASCLGMSPLMTMRRIVLPQAFRIVIPPIANYSVGMIKDSALVSVIAVTDLLRAGQLLASTTYKHFQIYTYVAGIYLVLCYPLTLFTSWLEQKLRSRIDRVAPVPEVDQAVREAPAASAPDRSPALRSDGPLIEVRNVSKQFHDHPVLDRIELTVARGEVIVVLGPSGSGKSTLLRTLNKLETIDDGQIVIDGMDIWADKAPSDVPRARVGMVFQQFNLFPHRTVIENVIEAPIHVAGLPRRQAEAEALALLDKVGLLHKAGAYPAKLSGGQQQRVAIARALAMHPDIMLFDEVTSALDPELVGEVLRVMRQLATDGMTMFVVTHEMNFARDVADRILFLAEGRIIEQSTPEVFFSNPATDRARAFVASFRG
ncbi:amino acid ABC transporter permease/ATP-binding protein [Bosea sp. 117]|uniref:amino acid ABC transporter permease/ATP-binding protein n=1 Tax=Bosea sp. 117 TaxID=1125973 RepID=UPI000493C995|nr:amino acid ABC transporter permease/ATP-binding protein [Bosea sp. 117]